MSFPSFSDTFPFIDHFILDLVAAYKAGKIASWDDLDKAVKDFYTPMRLDQVEALIPGWKKMCSYSDGITLTHVTCVFVGVTMLPEFQALNPAQQQMARWIVLFHDLDKIHFRGKKDTMHAFRSGAQAARVLPTLGFSVLDGYGEAIAAWSSMTVNAYKDLPGINAPIPDNRKLPDIVSGIDRMFGADSPASLITKTILLHISLAVDPYYPTPAPLTDAEIRRFITPALFPLLRVMMLGDNEGWSLFEPEVRERQFRDTRKAFNEIGKMIGVYL